MDVNVVMEFCTQGMAAEGAGDADEARQLFEQAWAARQDDFDACIAAHYLARYQITAEARLEWNQRSLRHADAVRDERVASFYPSLYLNLGSAHEELARSEQEYEDVKRAREFFARAAASAEDLPAGGYADMVKREATAGLRRADAILGVTSDADPD